MGEFSSKLQKLADRSLIHLNSAPDGRTTRLTLGDYQSHWVTPSGVLTYLAQWAAPRPAKAQPSDDLRRLALGAATALAEAIQRLETQSGAPWERALPIEASGLALLMGVSPTQAQKGLDWLDRVGVTRRDSRGWVQVDETVWEPAPVLAAVAWDVIRERLREGRVSLAPELALVRALALQGASGMNDARDRENAGWCSISYAELAEITLFKRSAVMQGMAALQAVNILEQDERSGRRARWRLTPAALGQDEPAVGRGVSTQGDELATTLPQNVSPLPAVSRAPVGGSQDVTIQVAGLSLTVPIGTSVRVAVDNAGRRHYHIGDDLVIGPVE